MKFSISNWWLEVLAEGTSEILDGVETFFFGIIRGFYEDVSWFMDYIDPLCVITMQIASVLLALMAGKHLVTTYLLETDGDSEIEPLQYMVKVTLALAIIQSHFFIFTVLQNLSSALCAAIDAGFHATVPVLSISELWNVVMPGGGISAFSIILIVVYVVMIIMMFFKVFLRAVELGIQKAVFPIFCVDFLSPGQEKWKSFTLSYGVTFFGYIIQYVCFRISVSLFFMGISGSRYIMGALAAIYFGIKSPKWIEKYVYTSGVGQTISGGARSAVYMLPTLARMGK